MLLEYNIVFEDSIWQSLINLLELYNKMSLWVDKYRPTTLAKLDYHLDQAEDLRNMVIII
jgi:hypothetical protein